MSGSQDSTTENVHIPRYIKNQPWYYRDTKGGEDGKEDYLVHHRQLKKGGALEIDNNSEPKVGHGISDEFETVKIGNRGGRRCENCGATGHVRRDCLERARKIPKSAEDSGLTVTVRRETSDSSDWDARKDRWFGYTGKEYDELLKKWENRKIASAQPEKEELWDTDEEVELIKLGLYKDTSGLLKQDDSHNTALHRASVRLREDRAAYLNDVHSQDIKYDPKSRLYKSEELGSIDEESHMFRRHLTGEAQELDQLKKFTLAHAKKMGVRDELESDSKVSHVLIANPTKYEQMLRQERKKQPPREASITELQAKKTTGTAQSRKAKQDLKDLYG